MPIFLALTIRNITDPVKMVIKAKLMIPAMSIDFSTFTVGSRWDSSNWSIDVLIGVSLDDSFNSGRCCSRVDAFNFVAKLK